MLDIASIREPNTLQPVEKLLRRHPAGLGEEEIVFVKQRQAFSSKEAASSSDACLFVALFLEWIEIEGLLIRADHDRVLNHTNHELGWQIEEAKAVSSMWLIVCFWKGHFALL